MPAGFDLDAYLDRILWRGDRAPTYATLAGILAAHTRHVPFENFDVLLGRPIALDPAALHAKIVRARRGGYCFEHASLMAAALEALGFQLRRHIARVILYQPATEAPRDHMFLTVAAGGSRFVIDPGFGPFASSVPIPLDGTPTHDGHHMTQDGSLWRLHGSRRGEPFTGWASPLEDDNPIDFVMSNHFTSTHPGSIFRRRIFASAVTGTGRINLLNRDVTRIDGAAESPARLADRQELRALLARHFGFDLPEAETLTVPDIPEWT